MWSRLMKTKLLFVIVAVLALVAAMACAAEEAEEPVAPAAAAPAAPAATAVPAAAAAPAAAPAAPQAPAAAAAAAPAVQPAAPEAAAAAAAAPAAAPEREAPTKAPEREKRKYEPSLLAPGEFFFFGKYDGPMPTTFRESPASAELVRQGKLPPLEERLPVPEDVMVIPPPDEIGIYGGIKRITATGGWLTDHAMTHCLKVDADRAGFSVPFVCKSWELSEDGRVYTFGLRNGVKYHDGVPVSVEDFRFAWEDLNFNEEFNPKPSPLYVDAVTGNLVQFNVVDDWTWTLTFDTPNYTLIQADDFRRASTCTGWCWYSPSHYYKKFHPKYADPAELKELMKNEGVDTWMQLFKKMNNVRQITGIPWTGAWHLGSVTEQQAQIGRNHYFFAVDPEGNQLPYLDGVTMNLVESREAGIFRDMNGETDASTGNTVFAEIPLYLANMEKGDYSIYKFLYASGNDVGISMNQEHTKDPEIGALLRTKDFRIALSLGIDRDAINETVFLGLATPQNWVPHPSTPYYPGAEWATKDGVYDPARANIILDTLGLVDTDADGYRNRLDGKGNLELYFEAYGGFFPILEQIQAVWKDIGIKLSVKEGQTAYNRILEGEQYFYMGGNQDASPWTFQRTQLAPLIARNVIAPDIGRYYETAGKEGMAPTGPDPNYLPLSPEGTYPADTSGNLKKLQELWTEGAGIPSLAPRRIEIGKEIFRINAEEKHNLGLFGFTGMSRGIMIKRNNFRNVPRVHGASKFGFWAEVYSFEDGIDNINHLGNRSKKYKSISFLDPDYWD